MKSKSTAARGARSYGLFVNCLILILIVAAIGAKLFVSNNITSQRFAADIYKKELHILGNNLAEREAELSSGIGMARVTAFARQSGMVPGSQSKAMFLSSGVAFIHGSAQD